MVGLLRGPTACDKQKRRTNRLTNHHTCYIILVLENKASAYRVNVALVHAVLQVGDTKCAIVVNALA